MGHPAEGVAGVEGAESRAASIRFQLNFETGEIRRAQSSSRCQLAEDVGKVDIQRRAFDFQA